MGLLTSSAQSKETVTQFSFDSLMAKEPIRFSDYQGKVLLIVNTASKCGFTGQYDGLEKLYQTYKDKGLFVIGVPSNDFGAQEPGTHEEIAQFCKLNFGVSFPMTAKYEVTGKNAHPFYIYAKKELGFGTAPKWNFHKYLINRQGQLVNYFHSTTKPDSTRLIKAIEAALDERL
jgi:glutathione peroxidase